METNAIASLIAAVANIPGLGAVAVYAPATIALAAVLAAVLPTPATGSPWLPARKLLDLVAMNFGNATNNAPKQGV